MLAQNEGPIDLSGEVFRKTPGNKDSHCSSLVTNEFMSNFSRAGRQGLNSPMTMSPTRARRICV